MMDLFKKLVPGTTKQDACCAQAVPARIPPERCNIQSFILVRTLGTGSFGRVFMAKQKHAPNGRPVAIKRLKKANVIKQKQVDHIQSERSILASISHPFVVNMLATFKDERFLYIVMDYVIGGEFFTHLRKHQKFENDACRFYAAQVVLIFEYLHSKNIVYRDLKPENILLDAEGYLKLTDFGFAKTIEYRTYTLCGTPEYIAPEVLLNRGHGKPVDWWTLGILVYEMVSGYPPFIGDEPMEIYKKILTGKIVFPGYMDKNAKALIKRLVTPDLAKRYGNLRNGVDDIKQHKWFCSLCFDSVLKRSVPTPLKPVVKGLDDCSNFDTYEESKELPCCVTCGADPFVDW